MKKPYWTYVDMDGVIADFFGALAKEFGVQHWKDIPTHQEVIIVILLHGKSSSKTYSYYQTCTPVHAGPFPNTPTARAKSISL